MFRADEFDGSAALRDYRAALANYYAATSECRERGYCRDCARWRAAARKWAYVVGRDFAADFAAVNRRWMEGSEANLADAVQDATA